MNFQTLPLIIESDHLRGDPANMSQVKNLCCVLLSGWVPFTACSTDGVLAG